jgi:hypothetical protein
MMMKRIIAFLVAATFVGGSMLTGCSDDTTNNSSGNPPPAALELSDLSPAVANLFCGLAFSCCTPMEQTQMFKDFPSMPKTAEECEPVIKTQFDMLVFAGLKEGVDAGRLKFDGVAAKTCLGQSEGQCATFIQGGPFGGMGCETVFVGLVANGGDCAQDNECATAESTCVIPQNAMLGKCQPLPKEGEACPSYQCATGLACGKVNMMDVCIKPGADGQMCSGSQECISEYCDFTTNICGQPKALGEACVISYDCKDGYCETQAKVCTALKAEGQACMSSDECQNHDCPMATMTCGAGAPKCDGI